MQLLLPPFSRHRCSLRMPPALDEIGNGSFDGAAGQLQLCGDGTNRRVAFAVLVGIGLCRYIYTVTAR
jgi:hypothetical protein